MTRLDVPAHGKTPAERWRDLPGWLNLRDLGGLPTADGRRVRHGRLFRGENPLLDDGQTQALVDELGLGRVVDLRRAVERDAWCLDWSRFGVDYVRWPLSAGAQNSWHAAYDAYLTYRPETVVGAVTAVLEAGEAPVLFHCAAGKDRTGVVAALLLCLMSVDADAIVADYVLTKRNLRPLLQRMLERGEYGVDFTPELLEGQIPGPSTMRDFLGFLDGLGGAASWLIGHGVSAAAIERFRERNTEPV